MENKIDITGTDNACLIFKQLRQQIDVNVYVVCRYRLGFCARPRLDMPAAAVAFASGTADAPGRGLSSNVSRSYRDAIWSPYVTFMSDCVMKRNGMNNLLFEDIYHLA